MISVWGLTLRLFWFMDCLVLLLSCAGGCGVFRCCFRWVGLVVNSVVFAGSFGFGVVVFVGGLLLRWGCFTVC